METKKPNYDECITNLACSMLKYFEVPYKHNTIKDVDDMLDKYNPKNVVVILYDGMGYNLVNRILDENSFLRQNMIKYISSTSPSTTTSSTTSMLNGLNPCEHGWLGWDVYVEPENKTVTLFLNTLKDTRIKAADYSIGYKYLPYDNLKEQINKGPYNAEIVFPFPLGESLVYHNRDLKEMNDEIIKECNKDGKKYIYVYYEEPDSIMHDTGTNSNETINMFHRIDKSTRDLANSLDDTLLIVTADHGHINCSPVIMYDHKDLFDTLDGDVSIEARFCSIKVKKGREKEFVELFNKYYGEYFLLKTKEEILNEKWFGIGEENELFNSELGDYVAIGISDKFLLYKDNDSSSFKSHHAGITKDEMEIPLIMKMCKK